MSFSPEGRAVLVHVVHSYFLGLNWLPYLGLIKSNYLHCRANLDPQADVSPSIGGKAVGGLFLLKLSSNCVLCAASRHWTF